MPNEYKQYANKGDGLFAKSHARKTDPDTSHMAAGINRCRRNELMRELLYAFVSGGNSGFTDEQAYHRMAHVDGGDRSWWKRCSDLRQLGFILPTGEKRKTVTGAYARVCSITKDGRAAVGHIAKPEVNK